MQTVDQWIRDGMPVVTQGRRGQSWQFDLPAVVKWYGDRCAAKNSTTGDEREIKRRKLEAETGLAELELSKAMGEVAPIAEIEKVWTRKMAIIRTNVLNVTTRAVIQLLGETNETEFKRKLRAELSHALESAANAEIELNDEEEVEG